MRKLIPLIVAVLCLALAANVMAKKPRKLPRKAYLSGAKIAGGFTGETPRRVEALALLDSCLMYYGPIPEAYFWRLSIYSELAGEMSTSDTAALMAELGLFKTSYDSLIMSCDKDNKELGVKKKLRKKCSDFQATADSLQHEWYAEYFNLAQESRNLALDTLIKQLEELTDEEDKVDMQKEIEETIGLAIANYKFASIFKPDDIAIAINMGQIYTSQNDYAKALPYQLKAAAITKEEDPEDSAPFLNDIAYSYFELKEFEKAAATFKEITSLVDDKQKITQYKNVIACYQSLQEPDSVYAYNYKILEIDPDDARTLSIIGGVWFNRIQELNMSRSDAREADDKALLEKLDAEHARTSDSANFYLKRAFEADSTDDQSIKFYAINNTISSNFEQAAWAWEKLTRLSPEEKSYWKYLGENFIRLRNFKDAVKPFEKLVELDDTDLATWERLVELYNSNSMPGKAKKAKAKVAELSKS